VEPVSTGYKEAKRTVPAKRYIPLVQVSFHTSKECYQTFGVAVDKNEALDPTYQVLAVSTQKSMAAPAGAFTVSLVGDEWIDKLTTNDMVVIQMGYRTSEGDKMNTVMVGLIDRVRRTRDPMAPMVSSTITGRDFGKVLIKSQLKFYPQLGSAAQSEAVDKAGEKFFLTNEGWMTMLKFFTADQLVEGTPAVMLDNIIRYILPKLNTVEWTVWDERQKKPVPKKVDIRNIIRYNLAAIDLFLPMVLTSDQFEGAVWNLMERAAPKPFTELFIDVREASEAWNAEGVHRVVNETIEEASDKSKEKFPKDGGWYPAERLGFGQDNAAVMIALRNTPFDKVLWEQLYVHYLDAQDVISEDLSLSDDEHYNLFWAGTTINPLGFSLKEVSPPLWNEHDVKRYGISPLEVEIEGLSISPLNAQHPTLLEGMSRAYSAKLKAWFEFNHQYLNGSQQVRGKGNYKIGQRLIRAGIKREFYIEGVTQQFNVFVSWETTLQLTRGMPIGGAPDHTNYLPKPPEKKNAPNKPTGAKSDSEVKGEYYTVKNGDSLWSIAAKKTVYGRGDDWTKLWEANKDQLIKRDKRNVANPGKYLYSGQSLRVPKKG
jgi:LysM repeat protein